MTFNKGIDIVIMNEINVKMNAEQIALLNKLLSPYVELYQSINIAFQKSQIISSHPTPINSWVLKDGWYEFYLLCHDRNNDGFVDFEGGLDFTLLGYFY